MKCTFIGKNNGYWGSSIRYVCSDFVILDTPSPHKRYDRDIFCESLSTTEPQAKLQNKETTVQSYQKMLNQNTKKSPEDQGCTF